MTEVNRVLRIIEVVASIEAEASGPSYTVPSLARALRQAGNEVELMSLGEPGETDKVGVRHSRFVRALTRPSPLARLGVSPSMRTALEARAGSIDILHTHGLWMMPNVYPAMVARKHSVPFVLSPRGMLNQAALKYSAVVKRVFWIAAQARAVRAVSLFHATSEQEYEDIRAYGLIQPVAIIPNGIDVPREPASWSDSRTVLSLGRLHPKKGLDVLLAAWSRIEPIFPEWRLRIVGPSEGGHAEELQRLAKGLGLRHASIEGPVFGSEKHALYEEAELFALSTRGENFAMTVAESLAFGTPVISTKGAPWSALVVNGCGWWIDHGAEAMAATLHEAMSLPSSARAEMGRHGSAWMAREFSWPSIGRQMAEAYYWARHGGDIPETIRR